MTNADFRNSRFALDVTRDLERVDSVFTSLLKDRSLWSEFLDDPNGVLTRLGLHPSASSEANSRANRVFYAVLSNRELIQLAIEIAQDIQPSDSEREYYRQGLREGVIQNQIEYDLRGINLIFSQTERVRRLYQLGLYDVNDKGILTRRYSQEELDDYINRMIEGVQNGLSISELPTLETWDDNYGVGTGYGFGEAVVGPVALAVAAAEVGIAFTVAVAGAAPQSMETSMGTLFEEAATGDSESAQALDILTRLNDLASDLMTHVQSLEANG